MGGRTRYAVGLSGGVDSSVAAALLVGRGHEVTGVTMRVYDGSLSLPEGAKHSCFGPGEEAEIETCGRLCAKLGIPYRVIDLRPEYREFVLEYFRSEYLSGRTPNPCVRCNLKLKFGFLVERARASGVEFDRFATGHYARIGARDGKPCLMRAVDRAKDQSYFIYRLDGTALASTEFPLGELSKPEVRKLAAEQGLETAGLPESQDFISGGDYSTLFKPSELREGDIVDGSGKVVGRHRGIAYYTIGQRRGVGVATGRPVYVSRIDPGLNRIVISADAELFSSGLVADAAFLAPGPAVQRIEARIRQNHRPAPGLARIEADGSLRVDFDLPQRGVAPGQSVVLYDGDYVIGGGEIRCAVRPSADGPDLSRSIVQGG